MMAFLENQLGVWGYWLILFISFAEAFVFTGWVVPGTVVVVIAGGLAAHGTYSFAELVCYAVVGAILGDGLSYELGRRGKRFTEKRPFLQKQIKRGTPHFQKHQVKTIFFGRFIGWLRPVVPFIAGLAQMDRPRFYIANVISAIAWAIAYLGLGYVFGAAWRLALLWATRAGLFILSVVTVVALFAWLWRWAVQRGPAAWTVARSIGHSIYHALKENPYVRSWTEKHKRSLTFIRARFSVEHFSGMPLTFFAIAILVSTYALFGITEDYLTNDPLAFADVRITNLLYAVRTSRILHFFYGLTLLAEKGVVIPLASLLVALLWFYQKRIYILTLLVTVGGSQTVTALGKVAFSRVRPEGPIPAILEKSYSFPSGHATGVVAFYGCLAYFYIRNGSSWKIRIGALGAAAIVVVLVDFSRLYLGVHYLSDVLAGNMVGLTILLFAISLTEWRQWERRLPMSNISLVPAGAVGAAAVLLVAFSLTFRPLPWKEAVKKAEPVSIGSESVLSLFEERRLPRYTETLVGTPQEPLNFILVGREQCMLSAFKDAGWVKSESISFSSTLKLMKAALLNEAFPSAPIIPSFYNGFPHDFGLQKVTGAGTVRSRHHARLWKLNYESDSGPIFAGTASLDTGIKWGIAHSIDPAIDIERDLLVSDLEKTGMIAHFERVPFVLSKIGKNFAGDPFFTDGKIIMIKMNRCP